MKPAQRLARLARIASVTWMFVCLGLRPVAAQETEPPCRAAAAALAAGRAEEALALYPSCVAAAPSFRGFKGLAESQFILGHYEEAVHNFHLAMAMNPEDPDTAAGLGQALMKLARYEEAAHQLERAVVFAPENLRARTLLAMALFELKQYELAAIEAEQVLRRDPTNISAAFILGASDVRLRLYARAVPLLEHVRQLTDAAPSAEIRATLGKAHLGVHQGARALGEFRAAEKMEPQMPGLYSEIGAAYAELGDRDSALEAYEKALQADANDFAANFGLARLDWVAGHYDAARAYLAKSSQAAPDDPEVQLLSAELSVHDRDYAHAKPLLENVVRALPDNIHAHVLLSQVYFHLGQMDEAKQEEGIAGALRKAAEK